MNELGEGGVGKVGSSQQWAVCMYASTSARSSCREVMINSRPMDKTIVTIVVEK